MARNKVVLPEFVAPEITTFCLAKTQALRNAASTPTDTTSFVDISAPQTVVSYTIRSWIDNIYTDIDCGTVDLTVDTPEPACSVTADNNDVTVTWNDTAAREILRRYESWLSSPTADTSSFTHNSDTGTHNYQLRTWQPGGQFIDTDCGSVTIDINNPPTCSTTLVDSDVTVTWDGFVGKEVLRRNDSWRNTPAAGTLSFVDTNIAHGTYDYTIRVWQGGVATDTECGSVTVA